MPSLTRRMALKFVALGTSVAGVFSSRPARAQTSSSFDLPSFNSRWDITHDRVWLGEELWANPMEDWRIVDGAAECQSFGGDRNIHLITHQLTNPEGKFQMTLHATRAEVKKQDGGFGFRVGVHSEINEYRSNCFAKNGITCGVVDNQLVLGPQKSGMNVNEIPSSFRLVLTGEPSEKTYKLTLTALDPETGAQHGTIVRNVPIENILGNVAIVNNLDAKIKGGRGSRYRFHKWTVTGNAFTVKPERKFGPILWSMYSLSDSRSDEGFVMKISALTGPLGKQDNHTVELQAKFDDEWKSLGQTDLDTDAWTATFRVPNWNEKQNTPFKLIYREQHKNGLEIVSERTGIIRENPSGRPLRLAALTCQNDYGFPYEPVANNLLALDPDMLYFSGDQLYENHGGYGLIRDPAEPAILNYLRKYYQHGWSFGEAMRDRPTLCLPDDHDVFQGNIWGEGGAKMTSGSTSSKGGYREPARMVNVVHKTNTAHHPDPYDAEPCKQDISVYYGEMIYGGVGFAIIADRQWKSGPERVETGSGRADHVSDPDFDTQKLDRPGLILLGERQEEFLKEWAKNWDGHALKVLLSQTVFAGVATHHGGYNGYLKADLDCGSWPQTPRNNAVRIIRKAKPLHINGDQHLTTLTQYGVDEQRDSNWSFCTPAIAAGYPRWWRPDEIGMPHENRPEHGLPNTGEFIDGFGNKAYVYAVGNPEVGTKRNRYEKAHQKGSGFGFVTIDPKAKTYHIESFRFLIDATDGKATNQFPGWPVTIHQQENEGDNLLA